jgi:hypothetical protein
MIHISPGQALACGSLCRSMSQRCHNCLLRLHLDPNRRTRTRHNHCACRSRASVMGGHVERSKWGWVYRSDAGHVNCILRSVTSKTPVQHSFTPQTCRRPAQICRYGQPTRPGTCGEQIVGGLCGPCIGGCRAPDPAGHGQADREGDRIVSIGGHAAYLCRTIAPLHRLRHLRHLDPGDQPPTPHHRPPVRVCS